MNEYREKSRIEDFKKYLICGEKSKGTVEKYLRDVQAFFHFLKEGIKADEEAAGRTEKKTAGEVISESADISDITKEKTIAWKEHLVRSGYAASTVNSMLASLNSFLRFHGLFSLCVRPLRRQHCIFRDQKRELSEKEYLKLIKTAKETGKQRLYFILQTIAVTGIRISELRFITVESLQYYRTEVKCKGKQRTVLLTQKLCEELLRYCRERQISSGPVFITKNGNPVDRSNVWTEMKRLCPDAGVEPSKVFPHNLRHLFARIFYNLKHDIAKLADLLGHSSIDTTRIYIMESGQEHENLMEQMGTILLKGYE